MQSLLLSPTACALLPGAMRDGRGGKEQVLAWFSLVEQHACPSAFPGGAWTIGYKAWGALLAERLSAAGVLVLSLDYRNFPQASTSV